MNLPREELSPDERRFMEEAAIGYGLFTTKDAAVWMSYLEDLGKLCGEASQADLSATSAASLPRNLDASKTEPPPSWPFLLDAVRSACFACLEGFKKAPAKGVAQPPIDPEARLKRTYLWTTLSSDDTADELRDRALRAFRRGFRLGRRGTPSLMKRPILPMLDPPRYWGADKREYPGPSAARERAIRALPFPANREELEARGQALRELYAGAWRDDVPEEDRAWADAYRTSCSNWVNRHRRNAIAQSAYEAYLQSSGVDAFHGGAARPWTSLSKLLCEPWRAFVDRVNDASDGESELETAEAAAREAWDALYQEPPPWDSDPAQAHWLAAVRAARTALTAGATSTE
jgi:hypothetical protein